MTTDLLADRSNGARRHFTQRVVDASRLRADRLTPAQRDLAHHCLLDWFGVAMAAVDEPLVAMLAAQALDEGSRPVASPVGGARSLSARQAALVNGAMAHALDYDDVNVAMKGHPTVAILAGVAALAEAERKSGNALLSAFVVGYEAACIFGEAVATAHYARGFHTTGTIGAIGAAAASAHLLGLDDDATCRAYAIAATQAAGLKSQFGTMCKPLHAGRAAEAGINGALLARRGMTSHPDILGTAQGFADAFGGTLPDGDGVVRPEPWLMANLFKYHAACYGTHATIDAAAAVRGRHGLAPDAIERVVVRVSALMDRMCNIAAPATGLEAKFSLRFNAALALSGATTADPALYDDATAHRADLVGLRDRVQVELMDRDWPDMLAEVIVHTHDGRRLEARSNSEEPSTDTAEQSRKLGDKFDRLVVPRLGMPASDRLKDALLDIESIDDMRTLFRLAQIGGATGRSIPRLPTPHVDEEAR